MTRAEAALECWREAGEPEFYQDWNPPRWRWWSGALAPQSEWWCVELLDFGDALRVDIHCPYCVDLLPAIAALQAAHTLAENLRAEREAQKTEEAADAN